MRRSSPVTSTLDPEIAAVMADNPRPEPLSMATLAARRALFPPPLVAPLSDGVERTDHETRAHGPVVRVHRPVGAVGPMPCLYWMHAGGYVLGNRFLDDLRFDTWCQRHQMIAVSVEYRLAPETQYPGPLDDCRVGLQWTVEHASELGIEPTRIGIGGASAGGGLAAALALLNRDRGSVPLAFQLLVYPMLDDRQITPSSRAEVPSWSPAENAFGWSAYLADLGGAVDEYAAPARAENLRGLPRAYVTVGALDLFLDEDIDYATRLMRAGVATDLRVYPGLPHGFDGIAPSAAASKRAQRDLNEWLSRALQD
jgi:acetyl esterase/lipase